MNSLSWLIYLGSVVGSLNAFLTVFGVLGISAGVIMMVVHLFMRSDGPSIYSWDNAADKLAQHKATVNALSKYGKLSLKFAIPAILVSCFLPRSNTVYAIAASEMGERALNTETGGKAVQALNAWLDRQISDQPEPAKQ